MQQANTTDSLNAIAEEIAPQLSANTDAMYLNDKLFERVKTVFNSPEKDQLTTEQQMVLKHYYNSFVRGGANLSPEKKERLKAINSELAVLSLKFGDNQLKETNAYKLVIGNSLYFCLLLFNTFMEGWQIVCVLYLVKRWHFERCVKFCK